MSRGHQVPVASRHDVVYGAVTLSGRSFQIVRLSSWFVTRRFYTGQALQPHRASTMVWAVPRSLAATSGITVVFCSSALRWFTSPGCLLPAYGFSGRSCGMSLRWVAPFGNPRVKACLRLTEAYRSLPRPSSTPGAKAFTVRP